MFNTSELDELVWILISIKGFKLKQPQWSNTTIARLVCFTLLDCFYRLGYLEVDLGVNIGSFIHCSSVVRVSCGCSFSH